MERQGELLIVEDSRACLVHGVGAVVSESTRVWVVIIDDTLTLYLTRGAELEVSCPRYIIIVRKRDLNYAAEVLSGCPVSNNRPMVSFALIKLGR